MRLPNRSAASENRIAFGRYVARRLRRARLSDEESEVLTVTAALREASATADEAGYLVQDGLADRDASDSDLDDIAKRHRRTLEGRGTTANRERPYTDIYPQGMAWYTEAPLPEQVRRYELLVRRYEEFLPFGDPIRAEAELITSSINHWTSARRAVDQAGLDVAMARAKKQSAADDWDQTLTRLYFRLAERLGKTNAERFFPRTGRARRTVEANADNEAEANLDAAADGED